jgi:ketosteroid isomerase-like protein
MASTQHNGTTREQSRPREDEVKQYLERFARALTAGDGRTIATMWGVPALVMGGGLEGKSVQTKQEVEQFFAGAKDQYNAKGIVETRPVIQEMHWISPEIVMVKVRWPYIGKDGKEQGAESSTYTLTRNAEGKLEMRVVMMHGEEKPSAPTP